MPTKYLIFRAEDLPKPIGQLEASSAVTAINRTLNLLDKAKQQQKLVAIPESRITVQGREIVERKPIVKTRKGSVADLFTDPEPAQGQGGE